MKLTTENIYEMDGWCRGNASLSFVNDIPDSLTVHTPEGDVTISLGNYLVRGVNGKFYAFDGPVFEATYEPLKPSR